MQFYTKLLPWYDQYGRKDLPWQHPRSSYYVWLSEIMLQQTQVKTVIPYFERFVSRFPDIAELAQAELDEVLHLWTGLGYYARARNLHKAAIEVVERFNGVFPNELDELESLPGIGRSTAAAIRSQAFNERATILDGNVKRVLTRLHAIDGWPGKKAISDQLWSIAEEATPYERNADYTQAIMDLGATLCTRSKPQCHICPIQEYCLAHSMDEPTRFPTSKPKKEKPVKSAFILIYRNEHGAFWLEQRPPTGLWGGLYCFPESDSKPSHFNEIAQLDVFRHTFSHYHFDMKGVLIDTQKQAFADSNGIWYDPMNPTRVGLAAPVLTLMQLSAEYEIKK